MEEFLSKVLEKHKDKIVRVKEIVPWRVIFEVPSGKLKELAKDVFETYRFRLSTISTLDQGFYFELLYHFVKDKYILTLKTIISKENPRIPSLTDTIPGANWLEREVRDLFGIEFEGHVEPERVVLPPDWTLEPPLRKPIAPKLPPTYAEYLVNLTSKAALASITGIVKRRRTKMGLPEVVAPVLESKKVIEEIKKISKELEIDRKVPVRK